MDSTFHATTILAVRRDDRAVLAGDGQVTLGNTAVKQSARKIRRLYNDHILAGFAGPAADSCALRGEARAISRQPRALRGRTGQGLAHRPRVAPPRGDAGRARQAVDVPAF